MNLTSEEQYLALMKRILNEGTDIHNERTSTYCRTVINADLEYDASTPFAPILTTRKLAWKPAIAEILGYFKGFTSAAQFRELGCKTWDANANENESWLRSPFNKGPDDMGLVYGAVANKWPVLKDGDDRRTIANYDLFVQVYEDLNEGIDNRGEVITFWNPGMFHLGCLRPCMHTHTFSLLNGTLYLTSYQRSYDCPLGGAFNMLQAWFFLRLMAQITGNKPGKVFHKIVNAHIYENQLSLAEKHVSRVPGLEPTLTISPEIESWDDVVNKMTLEHVTVENYTPQESITYPFSV